MSEKNEPETLDAKKMMEIVERLQREGRMPSPEDFLEKVAEVKERLHKACVTLMSLKSEIRVRLEENKRYVGEYLSILDEMIDLVTHTGYSKPVYDRCRYPAKPSTPLFLHREV